MLIFIKILLDYCTIQLFFVYWGILIERGMCKNIEYILRHTQIIFVNDC